MALFANVGFSLVLMGPMKHGGLAFATSLASTVQFFLLILFLRRMPNVLDLRAILVSALKSLIASAAMGFCLHIIFIYAYATWPESQAGQGSWRLAFAVMILIFIGVGIYFAVARLLRSHELASLKDLIKPVLRRVGRR
jgi:putative peptidoglycan lipid II flippase